ncbi:MAG: hypothetical protein H7293_17685 [Candidatus Saccharibacteria bacterium]|nr:hypothetical protein [Rhodoferax sp.]
MLRKDFPLSAYEMSGASAWEIFCDAIGAVLIGFLLINLGGPGTPVWVVGCTSMAAGALAVLLLGKKI